MAKRKKKITPAKKSTARKNKIIDELSQIEVLIADSDLDIESIVSGDYHDPKDTPTDGDTMVNAILSSDDSKTESDGIPVLEDIVMISDRDAPPFASKPVASESVLDDPSMIMRVDPVKSEQPVLLPPPAVVTDQVMEIIENALQDQLGNDLDAYVTDKLRERIQQALSDWLQPEKSSFD